MKRFRRAFLASLMAAALLAAPASAIEVPNHLFKGVIFNGAPVVGPPDSPGVEDACGAAVTQAGAVILSDYYHRAVKFIGSEEQISGVGPAQNGPCALALDSAENLYVNLWHGPVVRYDAPAYGPPTTVDPGPAMGIAIDPGSGALYVDDRTSIAVYEHPSTAGGPNLRIGENSLLNSYGVAVSNHAGTAGWVYAADAGDRTVKAFAPGAPGTPARVIDGESTPQGLTTPYHGFSSLIDSSLTVDQNNGHLFVADNLEPGFEHPAAVVDEFNEEGLYRGQLSRPLVDAEPVAMVVNESPTGNHGDLYVSTGNGSSDVFPRIHTVPPSEATALYAFGGSGLGRILKLAETGAGSGSVTSKPAGIFCGGACEAEFNSGAAVALTATPDPGSAFVGWSGACSGTAPACEVTMSAAAEVVAEFGPAPALLAAGPAAPTDPARQASAAGDGVGLATIELGRARAQGATAVLLEATTSAAGTLAVSASGLRPARAQARHAGRVKLRLGLSRSGRRALARSKADRLAIPVSVSFTPNDRSRAVLVRRTVTFGGSDTGR